MHSNSGSVGTHGMFRENAAYLATISRSCERPYRVLLAWWHCVTLLLVVCFLIFLEQRKKSL